MDVEDFERLWREERAKPKFLGPVSPRLLQRLVKGDTNMPRIPVNLNDLPSEYDPLDEGLVYTGLCRTLVIADNPDKNGNRFLKLQAEVLEPEEWRGRRVSDNYIQIPAQVEPTMDGGERRKVLEGGVRFKRMATALGFRGDNVDTDNAIGREFQFTVRNEEYEGRTRSRIADYLI